MKKNILPVVALACAALALAAAVFSYISLGSTIKELENQVAYLTEQQALLRAQLDSVAESNTAQPDAGHQEAYCNLYVNDWAVTGGELVVSAFAQAVVPGGTGQARLELKWNGTTVDAKELAMYPGEAGDSLEAEPAGMTFPIPQMDAEDELELWMVITLADGSDISAVGAGWYVEDGQLCLISG